MIDPADPGFVWEQIKAVGSRSPCRNRCAPDGETSHHHHHHGGDCEVHPLTPMICCRTHKLNDAEEFEMFRRFMTSGSSFVAAIPATRKTTSVNCASARQAVLENLLQR